MNFLSDNGKRLIIIILFLWTVLVFFPGSYSVDTWNYYYQFTAQQYSDWHSPILAFLWYQLFNITGQYITLYVLQMLLYWYMMYVLMVRVNNNRAAFILGLVLSLLFLFIPQYVMKDTHAVISWGLALLLMLLNTQDDYKSNVATRVAILLLLAYGLFVRINAIFALLPLIYIYTELFLSKHGSVLKKAGISVLLSICLMVSYNIITYNLLKAERSYPQYKLMLLDIAGISVKTGRDQMPLCIASNKDYSFDTLKRLYSPASFDHIYWPAQGISIVSNMPDSALNACVQKAWKNAIINHPGIYFQNRLEGFLYYLRIKRRFEPGEYWDIAIYIAPENPIHINKPEKNLSGLFTMGSFTGTLFFDPWFWLLTNIIFFIVYQVNYNRHKLYRYKILAFLQLSAIVYTLSQFPVYQHDRDFRYHYWNVVVFIIGVVCVVGKQRTVSKAEG